MTLTIRRPGLPDERFVPEGVSADLLAALEQIDRACSHDLLRLTGKAPSEMRPEDRARSIQAIARAAIAKAKGQA